MGSLSAHLRHHADHGRLPFHPDCPVCCRDRLTGELPADAVVGRRTQALFAAGVIALSTASPTAVLAAEPDAENEGTELADPAVPQAPASAPDVDPGGDSTDLPVDVAPIPAADQGSVPDPAGDDGEPIEQEVASEEVAAAESVATDQQPAPPPPDIAPAPAEAVSPPSTPAPPVQAPTAAAPSTPVEANPEAPAPHKEQKDEPTRDRRPSEAGGGGAPRWNPAPIATAPPPAADPSAEAGVQVVQQQAPHESSAAGASRAKPGDRTHVVVSGESLWSIADDLLGDDASVARVAREVNRLWELNARRIGTGDPSLVRVGTTLLL